MTNLNVVINPTNNNEEYIARQINMAYENEKSITVEVLGYKVEMSSITNISHTFKRDGLEWVKHSINSFESTNEMIQHVVTFCSNAYNNNNNEMGVVNMENNLKEYLLDNASELKDIVSELNSWDGSLDDLRVYSNDEEFFDMFFSNNTYEAIRAVSYGEFNYTDDYVTFNVYGNLKSMNEWEYEEMLKDSIDDIIECLKENIDNISVDSEVELLVRTSSIEIKEVTFEQFNEENKTELTSEMTIDEIKETLDENENVELLTVSYELDNVFAEIEACSFDLEDVTIYLVDGKLYIATC